ncbi:MAG: hypothetical protein IPJ81_02300 [Chitinophagaceae bacterium]|nr:hypothetical protein [Chitinophagaceae bacterium]
MDNTIKEKLAYLNGYLQSIAIINSFISEVKTYSVKLLDKANNDIPETLCKYLEGNYTIDLEIIQERWQNILHKELAGSWFSQFISKAYTNGNAIIYSESNYNPEYCISWLVSTFINHLEELIDQDFKFIKVKINSVEKIFAEHYESNYIFDLGDQILFLHLGSEETFVY